MNAKRIIAGIVVTVMLFSMTGCNNNGETKEANPKEKIPAKTVSSNKEVDKELSLCYIGADDKFIKNVVKDFEDNNKGIKINIEKVEDANNVDEFVTKLKGNNKIDIICADGILKGKDGMFHKKYRDKLIEGKCEDPNYILKKCEEQNLLADITENISASNKNKELVNGIIDSYAIEDKTYRIPAIVTPIYFVTTKDEASKVNSIESLSNAVEESETPFLTENAYSYESLLHKLYTYFGSDLYAEDGSIKEQEMINFLEEYKKIAKNIKVIKDMSDSSPIESYSDMFKNKKCKLIFGEMRQMIYSFPTEVKLAKDTNNEEFPLNNLFVPHDILSINANSENKELAGKFIETALSGDVQGKIAEEYSDYGMPINVEAINKLSENEFKTNFPMKEDKGIIRVFKEGETEGVKVPWPEQKDFDKFGNMLKALNTPVCLNSNNVLKILLENAEEFVNGDKTSKDIVELMVIK